VEETSAKQPIDLRDVFRPVTSRLWLIVICVAVATALTYYHYNSQPRQYAARTTLYIGSTDPTQLLNSKATDRGTTDLSQLVTSDAVAKIAAKILGFKGDPDALAGLVSASPRSGSDFVDIATTSTRPKFAAAVANAFADGFVTNETQTLHNEAKAQINTDYAQLKGLPNTTDNLAQRERLLGDVSTMQGLLALPTAGVEHIDRALPPAAAFAPNPKKNAIFAFVITLMLAIAGCYGLDRLDRRIRKLADAERIYAHPILAAVPRTARPAPTSGGVAVLPDPVRESFRKLRMQLLLAGIDAPPKTIVVTSAVPREGKSTVTRNLALAYREAGLKACVIDCDLRRPGLASLLGVSNVPGLTDVMVGDETLTGALTYAEGADPGLRTLKKLRGSVPELSPESLHDEGSPSTGALAVLPTGPAISNPPVVLGSDQMRSILSTLADDFDVVLIDTSPLLAVTDAVPLLSAADGVLLVSRMGVTTSDAADEVVNQIRRIPGANLLGIVANDVRGRDAGMKRYSYAYGHAPDRVSA
jgi:Mrp family chromosome partitioning ATPase/capsular polysaccharide biosynthesis protein